MWWYGIVVVKTMAYAMCCQMWKNMQCFVMLDYVV